MICRFCIIRHGETDWNVEKRIQGQTDIPLNENGRAQAMAMAFNAAHYNFTAVYSSDLARARVTAEAVAAGRSLEVVAMPRLRERNYGIFQEITALEAEKRYPEGYAYYKDRDLDYDFENGESLNNFAIRVMDAFNWLARHHNGHVIAVVCHAGLLDVIYRKATGRPLHTPRDFIIPNCALNWFHHDGKGWHLDAWDDHHHLARVLLESAE
jgi:probable phosphoglycerate mutase